jgi:hypothetical protein
VKTSPAAAGRTQPSPIWVESMGGPLIAVPVSALTRWHGCAESGSAAGSGDVLDDYDRACEVDGLGGVIAVGEDGDQGLVLADEPALSCYLPDHQAFIRWLGAESEVDLIAAAQAVLADPASVWEECGVWTTDGPAVLMDSATAGAELRSEYPNGGGLPDQAPVSILPGSWTIRAVYASPTEHTSVGVIQLLPRSSN